MDRHRGEDSKVEAIFSTIKNRHVQRMSKKLYSLFFLQHSFFWIFSASIYTKQHIIGGRKMKTAVLR